MLIIEGKAAGTLSVRCRSLLRFAASSIQTNLPSLQVCELMPRFFVWSKGKFGRTPTINRNGGRDHWSRACRMVVAGGGIRSGPVVGRTDDSGNELVGDAYSPDDVAATFLGLMGIDHHKEYHTPDGRPIRIVRNGQPIREMVG